MESIRNCCSLKQVPSSLWLSGFCLDKDLIVLFAKKCSESVNVSKSISKNGCLS